MGYRIVAEVAMAIHFVFVVYVAAGGFLAWRWRWTFWPHLAAAGWGALITVFAIDCPLTHVEDWGRRKAGQHGLSTGFIDQYIEGVIYPERYTDLLRGLAFVVIAFSWLGCYWRLRRRGRQRGIKRDPGVMPRLPR
jgi:Protein of Unknown function (DUF2784)